MQTITRSTLIGLLACSGVSMTFLTLLSSPALALTFSQAQISSFTFNLDEMENRPSFTVDLDGNVNQTDVEWLSGKVTFTLLGFKYLEEQDITEVALGIVIENTTRNLSDGTKTTSTTSRISALGFNTDTDTGAELKDLNKELENQTGDTRVWTGIQDSIFTKDVENDALPNQFGKVDVCFSAQQDNNCKGGGSGGLSQGKIGSFIPILSFSGRVNEVTVSNIGVRYQDVSQPAPGTSGTGKGHTVTVAPGGSAYWAEVEESQFW